MRDPGRVPGRLPLRRPPAGRGGAVVRGLLLLGTGRPEGLEFFENSRDAFLAALAPPVGFLLVLGALLLAQHPTLPALCLVLLLLCAVLLPPVTSQAMARLWRREERWRRYATASLWCLWLVLPAYLPAMLVASVLLQMGVAQGAAVQAGVLLAFAYYLWLQWFLARAGLGISRLKAMLTVLAVVASSSLLLAAFQPLALELAPQVPAPSAPNPAPHPAPPAR